MCKASVNSPVAYVAEHKEQLQNSFCQGNHFLAKDTRQ